MHTNERRGAGWCVRLALLCLAVSLAAVTPGRSVALGSTKNSGPHVWDGSGDCNLQGAATLCIPLTDPGWVVVPMSSDVACDGAADPVDPCQRNDDDHSIEISLGFDFDLYGSQYDTVYINSNGNLSFGSGFCAFSSTGFPVSSFPMVAGFWADVDTQDPGANVGVVWMQQGPNYLAVTWDHVGYFSQQTDKLNTFQIIISDGSYSGIGLGNNVALCYGDMQWTTGDASDGVDGFGGTPATVGANKGDGTAFFQIGIFDHPGTDAPNPDLPDAPAGVDWLDGRTISFFAGQEINQPPIALDLPQDCVAAVCGEESCVTVQFTGPEAGQTVSVAVDTGGLPNLVVTNTPGNPAVVELCFTPDVAQEGQHLIQLTATDDGAVPEQTSVSFEFCVGCNLDPLCDAGGSYEALELEPITFDASASADPDGSIASYAWDFGDAAGGTGSGVSPTYAYDFPGTYTVTLTVTDNEGASSTCSTIAVISDSILDCGDAQDLVCDTIYPGGGQNSTTVYGACHDAWTLPEVIFAVTESGWYLFEWDAGEDYDAFILASCDPDDVVSCPDDRLPRPGAGRSASFRTLRCYLDAGQFVVLDGRTSDPNPPETQAPDLTVTCLGGCVAGEGYEIDVDQAQLFASTWDPALCFSTDQAVRWDFGDGTVTDGTAPCADGETLASHTYTAPGSFTLTFTLLDLVDDCGQSRDVTCSATVDVCPPAPAIDDPIEGCDGVTVRWSASPGASQYNIFRDDTQIAVADAATTSFLDEQATSTPGAYEVSAFGGDCESDRSESRLAGRILTPPQPAGVAATDDGCETVVITWNDVDGEEGYRVLRDGKPLDSDLPADVTTYTDVDALIGTSAAYAILAFNGVCESAATSDDGLALGPLSAPVVQASDSLCDMIELAWSAVPNATEYLVHRDGALLTTVTTIEFDDLAPTQASHVYRVDASRAGCDPAASVDVQGSLALPPAAPTGIIASGGCGPIVLTWVDVADEDGYRVIRDESVIAEVPADAITFQDDAPVGTYVYQIQAVNSCGDGTSDSAQAERLPGTAPVPTGLTAVAADAGCGPVTVSWNPLTDVMGYRLYRDGALVADEQTLPASAISFVDVAPTGVHTYTLEAIAACGTTVSPGVSAERLPDAPSAPQNTQASTDLCEGIEITWDDVDNEEGYRIFRDADEVPLAIVEPGATRFLDTLSSGAHTYVVEAFNSCGAALGEASGVRLPALPPAPTGVTASQDECDVVRLAWLDGVDEEGYRVWRDGRLIGTTAADQTSFDDTLAPTGTSTYAIQAINSCGISPLSTSVTGVRAPGGPEPTTGVIAQAGCSVVRVEWNPVVNAEGYRLIRDGELPAVVVTGRDSTAYSDTDVPVGPHTYQVIAFNACGDSGSEIVPGERLPDAPEAPAELVATPGCNEVRLAWQLAERASGYTVVRGALTLAELDAEATSYVDAIDEIVGDGDYQYTVVANNSCGTGSSTVDGRPILVPATPMNVAASDSECDRVVVTWDDVAGEEGVQVFRDDQLIGEAMADEPSFIDLEPLVGPHAYHVVARNSCGDSQPSIGDIGERTDLPSMPILSSTDTTFVFTPEASAIQLSWDAVGGASSLDIEIAQDLAFETILETRTVDGDVTETTLDLQGVSIRELYWRVRAINVCEEMAISSPATLTVLSRLVCEECDGLTLSYHQRETDCSASCAAGRTIEIANPAPFDVSLTLSASSPVQLGADAPRLLRAGETTTIELCVDLAAADALVQEQNGQVFTAPDGTLELTSVEAEPFMLDVPIDITTFMACDFDYVPETPPTVNEDDLMRLLDHFLRVEQLAACDLRLGMDDLNADGQLDIVDLVQAATCVADSLLGSGLGRAGAAASPTSEVARFALQVTEDASTGTSHLSLTGDGMIRIGVVELTSAALPAGAEFAPPRGAQLQIVTARRESALVLLFFSLDDGFELRAETPLELGSISGAGTTAPAIEVLWGRVSSAVHQSLPVAVLGAGSGSSSTPRVPILFHPVFPNPFKQETVITYELGEPASVKISVYAASGRHIATLTNEQREIGLHRVPWDGRDGNGRRVPEGVYFLKLDTGRHTRTQRAVVLR